ncbi:BTB/POZ and MATH domain-containing protein 1 [Hordeum vulgare]|nr:BTB/POZ and MATH domain-containing protein 1 [Hordeum vulgare]KAE8775814.1 BTB/POZ and MATH domain-containing protein 1 [Hordeum vulgare]
MGLSHSAILDAVTTPRDDPLTIALWNNINGLFNDHKINRQLHLMAELGDIKMGEMSMIDYLQKLKSLSDGLADLGSPVDDAEMVIHCPNTLFEQYESAANLISLMRGISFM